MRRSAFRRILKRWYYAYRPGERYFPYFGTHIYFPRESHLFDRVCDEDIYEPSTLKLLKAFLRPGTTYFDIGANIGLTSAPILAGVPDCQVVSFEPSPNALPWLEKTREGSPHAARWKVIGKALGTEEGSASFHANALGMSAFDGLRDTGRKRSGSAVTVQITTLDAEWQRMGSPAVSSIKVDVEGAEHGVLLGGMACIAQCKPAILMEWAASNLGAYACPPEALLAWAREAGYVVYRAETGARVQTGGELKAAMVATQNFLLLSEASAPTDGALS